jgi:putative two-component system response regulator
MTEMRIEAMRLVEAASAPPVSPRQAAEPTLAELGRALDPAQVAPSPESGAIFARALELIRSGNIGPDETAAGNGLLSIARYAYAFGLDLEGLAPSLQAVELFRRFGMRPHLRKALVIRGALLSECGNVALAIEAYAEAIQIAVELCDPLAEAAAWNNLGAAMIYGAQYQDAIVCLERALSVPEGDQEISRRGAAQCNIALACLHLEDYGRGLRAASSGLELLGTPRNPVERLARVIAEVIYTRLLLESDDAKAAMRRCEIAMRMARESGLVRAEMLADMAQGLCDVYCGSVDVGLLRLSKVVEGARPVKGMLRDALIAMVRANEVAGKADVAMVYLRELMMYTKEIQQKIALLHHRLHLEQVERERSVEGVPTVDALMARRETNLRGQLAEQVAHRELIKARMEMLERIAVIADLRVDPSGEHSYRVGKLAALLAQALGWDADTAFLVELAARVHDIGKIGIPEQVLATRRPTTAAEVELARSHALIGADILAQSDLPHMKMAEEIARFHHEHWDGGGYPFGLARSSIPVSARITALADAFDEMTHARAHEAACPPQDALRQILAQRGQQFDPELTDLFVALVQRLQRDNGDLDAFLGQAARDSAFIQARQRIGSMLKGFNGHEAIRA